MEIYSKNLCDTWLRFVFFRIEIGKFQKRIMYIFEIRFVVNFAPLIETILIEINTNRPVDDTVDDFEPFIIIAIP